MSMDQQATFNGWACVEALGHRRHIGHVTTQAFGQSVMFRVDTPSLPEREWKLERPEWINGEQYEVGTTVKRSGTEPITVLIGSGSIYQITPMTEEAAKEAIDRTASRPLIPMGLPKQRLLASPCSGDGCPGCVYCDAGNPSESGQDDFGQDPDEDDTEGDVAF